MFAASQAYAYEWNKKSTRAHARQARAKAGNIAGDGALQQKNDLDVC
jgi:hypothetical protein